MSSYQVEFFNTLKGNIAELETKLTADEKNNLTRSQVNTCYWAKALQQTFCDMDDVGMMLAMGASCDFNLAYERDKVLTEAHDKELKKALDTVAQRITEFNQGK
jgi:hypothetical protein